ncbi:MAG: hypothetical protein IPM04_11685 [Saprospiraceae bacterium]|nr:hypothetical protein [Candidatus Brachybacter algidus]MBK8748494.1 hypothetical protein [Candidatus Brachybacter algidus]
MLPEVSCCEQYTPHGCNGLTISKMFDVNLGSFSGTSENILEAGRENPLWS